MSDRIAVMRNGIFEQTGSAMEVYRQPATSYVARFVGNANVIKSDKGCLAIRSEFVDFTPADSGGNPGGIPARIIGRSFSGGQIRLTALLYNGEEIASSRQGMDSIFKTGMEVKVSWSDVNAILVKDTD